MKKHPRIRKLLLRVILPLILACIVLAVFLPALASTGFVRSRAIRTINSKIDGTVEIGATSFSWKRQQKIQAVSVADANGKKVATIDHILIGPSLWDLVTGADEFNCRIENLDADIVIDEQGVSNLEKALKSSSSREASTEPAPGKNPPADGPVFKGKATLEMINAAVRTSGPSLPIVDAHFDTRLRYDGNAATLQWKLDGTTDMTGKGPSITTLATTPGTQGSFKIAVNIEEILDTAGKVQNDKLTVKANAAINAFPMPFVDALLTLDGLAEAALGPVLDCNVKADGKLADIILQLEARSEHLAANIAFAAANDQLTLQQKGSVRFAVSRALIDHLVASQDLQATIEEPFDATLTLNSFSLPVDSSAFHSAAFSAELGLSPVSLQLPGDGKKVKIDSTLFAINSSRLQDGIDGTLGATIITAGQSSRSDITAKITNLFDKERKLSPSDAEVALDGTVDAPVDFLNVFVVDVDTKAMIAAVLGTKAQLSFNANAAEVRQRATLTLDSDNANARVNGTLSGGRAVLNEPLVATQMISKELSQTLLKSVNPILVTAVGSDRPIELRINNEGFVFPLEEGIAGFEMPDASLDFGKVILDNGGVLGRLITLLKQRSLTSTKQLEAWFTPMHATVSKGVATYQRADILVGGSLHLATWGSVNLTNNLIDMVIGLPADTLDSSFDLEGLAADYVLQIPVGGTTESPEIDWATAGRQLALMAAEKELGGKLGKASDLVSGVKGLLNKATGTSLVPEMPKAPAAPVLPWPSKDTKTKPAKEKEPEKPNKANVAKDLLDSLFE